MLDVHRNTPALRNVRLENEYDFEPPRRHNFAGSKIGRTSVRPEGVRAKDGAHQGRQERLFSTIKNLAFLAVNFFLLGKV
ncbi:MAG: hypothetical protein A2809_00895 [Candidatus Muproteobacteria bacterium RIFCSPHIGHO2_01_FULL_61_200]|nr:MAG: hypothetical protein A2809_00895 [Candidatus Muproteobacteria bacterium RIFCSPHIGHO2_01_FULL_61_200]